MAPWNEECGADLEDPLTSSHSEIGWQVVDLTHRLNIIRAQLGGKYAEALHGGQLLSTIAKGKALDKAMTDVDKLAAEQEEGKVKLLMKTDAQGEKRVTREARVVLLRIRSSVGGGKVLVELAKEAPGGKRRTDVRLPGGKMEPNEDLKSAVERIIHELKLSDCPMCLDFNRAEPFTEQGESASMPGVWTVYHMNIVGGYLTCTDEKVLARIGMKKDGAIWTTGDDSRGTTFYTWMNERQAQQMKVRMRGDHNFNVLHAKHKPKEEPTFRQNITDLTKKIDMLYGRERRFLELERGMGAVTPFMQSELSSVETVLQQNVAKRNYVVQHGDQLQEFVQTLHEIERMVPHLNPPHLPEVPGMCERVQRLESGAALLANASSRLHDRVATIAQDYHKTILGINAQMLSWDKLLDQKLEGKSK